LDHKKIELSQLLEELSILKCNSTFNINNRLRVISLLNSLDEAYQSILLFEQEIAGLFNKIKMITYEHIDTIKKSFDHKYYEQIKSDLI